MIEQTTSGLQLLQCRPDVGAPYNLQCTSAYAAAQVGQMVWLPCGSVGDELERLRGRLRGGPQGKGLIARWQVVSDIVLRGPDAADPRSVTRAAENYVACI